MDPIYVLGRKTWNLGHVNTFYRMCGNVYNQLTSTNKYCSDWSSKSRFFLQIITTTLKLCWLIMSLETIQKLWRINLTTQAKLSHYAKWLKLENILNILRILFKNSSKIIKMHLKFLQNCDLCMFWYFLFMMENIFIPCFLFLTQLYKINIICSYFKFWEFWIWLDCFRRHFTKIFYWKCTRYFGLYCICPATDREKKELLQGIFCFIHLVVEQ